MSLLDLQKRLSFADAIELHDYLDVVDDANSRAREKSDRAARARSRSKKGAR